MSSASPGFSRRMFIVAMIHGGVLLVICLSSLIHSCVRAQVPITIPDALVVEIPVDPADHLGDYQPEKAEPRAQEEKQKDKTSSDMSIKDAAPEKPKEKPKPKEKDKDKPKEKPKPPKEDKKKIETPDRKIKRPASPSIVKPKVRTKLTPEEIRKLLDKNARPGERPSLSDDALRRLANSDLMLSKQGTMMTEEELYLEVVRQTMYKAWTQPNSLAVQGLATQVEISLLGDGTITSSRMLRGSGNPVMDESVVKAVGAVSRISGLPPSFIEKHRTITVTFELSGNTP